MTLPEDEDEDEDEELFRVKPVIWQCACGRWQVQAVFLTGEVMYGTDTFDSKWEAAWEMAGRCIELGIKPRKTQ